METVLPVPATGSRAALLLRPWRTDDLANLLAAHQDPMLRRWLSTRLTDGAAARRWLDAQAAGWAAATRFSFAVVTAEDDRSLLGHLVVTVGTAATAEVGYWTAAHARKQGVAAHSLETASRWALSAQDVVPLTRLELLHAEDNQASCRVAARCGYRLHDILPPAPPEFPTSGHRHVRTAADRSAV